MSFAHAVPVASFPSGQKAEDATYALTAYGIAAKVDYYGNCDRALTVCVNAGDVRAAIAVLMYVGAEMFIIAA